MIKLGNGEPTITNSVSLFLPFALFLIFSNVTNVYANKTDSYLLVMNNTLNIPKGPKSVYKLGLNKHINRIMKGGQQHKYTISLLSEDYVNLIVYQKGIDVIVIVKDPDGLDLLKVDSPNGTQGPEPVLLIARLPGNYTVEVCSLDDTARPGYYKISVHELRPAKLEDKNRSEAYRDFLEAEELRLKGDEDSLLKSVLKYERSLSLYKTINDGYYVALALNNIGFVYNDLGQKPRALDYYKQALDISSDVRSRSLQAQILHNIGAVYYSQGYMEKALIYYKRALNLRTALRDQDGQAYTLTNIGLVYSDSGDILKSLTYYDKALLLARAAKDRTVQANVLTLLGWAFYSQGEMQKALFYYNQALPINKEIGDRFGQLYTLHYIGLVYSNLGQKREALDFFDQALSLSKTLGNRPGQAMVLQDMGAVYSLLGEKQKALEYYDQALGIRVEVEDRNGEAYTLNYIGNLYYEGGENSKALEFYDRALKLLKDVKDLSGQANVTNNMGKVYRTLGEINKADEHFSLAYQLSHKAADRLIQIKALFNLGSIQESQSEFGKALGFYQQSIDVSEKLRSTVTVDDLKNGLAEYSVPAYERAISLSMQLGLTSRAFDLSEKARARTFLDQIGNVRPKLRKGVGSRLIKEEEILQSSLSLLEQRLRERYIISPDSAINDNEIASILSQLDAKQREYRDLLTRLKLTNPQFASLRSISTLALSQIQRLIDRDTTLISYFMTTEKVLAFIITRNSIQAVDIVVKEGDLKATIKWFRGFASVRNPQPESLKRLYDLLIAPVKSHIKTSVVGIIPHGVLHYLPFAALTDGKAYFGDEHTIFYLPSASVLPFIQQKSKPIEPRLLALSQSRAQGLPVLQYADEEAETIASLYNAKAITTGNASRKYFLKNAAKHSILHLAAHGELISANPLFSRIFLAPDTGNNGSIEVRDIYDLDIPNTSLVVLSACETQLGAHSQGDDIVGLNRAFIYAGTPTVIASLWTVDDESTSYLMKAFYTHLKGGMSKAEALQAAQSDTRKKYAHPYYWAGFVLTGDPGQSAKK